jgi:hypothetical protein
VLEEQEGFRGATLANAYVDSSLLGPGPNPIKSPLEDVCGALRFFDVLEERLGPLLDISLLRERCCWRKRRGKVSLVYRSDTAYLRYSSQREDLLSRGMVMVPVIWT